ncbi:hypothetical protein F2Q68_00018627 [Brassica cretica]|uniref:xyloglucan 6-xylosyltransferase n=2 Tax=Brassica cretica TaxID=69181 RepID=A0A8S9G1F1_BRACR|nr:hypothetical protein F2Q68_00018627 [Brassica cretica]
MIERCLGPHRCRRIQRALRHLKVTVLCLVLTVVVLRGTIGAGKFGTPEQDLDEIRQHFQPSRKRAEPHRVLEEIQTGGDSSSSTSGDGNSAGSNNYETFDINKIFVDEGEEDKPDPNKPYTLGPKIPDWDEQRSDWLAKNPTFPNFIGPNKPRVLLVTGSAPKPCENPVGDHYLLKSIKNKIDYCRLHGIEIFYNMALLDAEMAGFWAKLPLIRKLLLSHPEVEFLWWMDSDAMFTDMAFELPWERYKEYNLVMHGWNEMVYDEKNWIGLNTGSFLLRNNQWALDLLDTWAPMGPKGKIREEAGKVLTRELKGRPVFEADDQSAMVYLLATQRDTWGNKGICAHVDLLRFEDGIAIVSLESPCVMRFSPAEKGEGEDVDVLLSPGSLILMSGEARYRWKHEINRKQIGFQVWEGEEIDQKRRISITLRKLCPS